MIAQQGVIIRSVNIAKSTSSKGIQYIHTPRKSAVNDYSNKVALYEINKQLSLYALRDFLSFMNVVAMVQY